MSRRLGFRLDLAGCIGCKACQVACKDEHDHPPGLLWRRVVEVAAGGWERRGETWVDASASYFVSVACCHCERPICVEVCPTRAMARREDGIVAVDAERCIGCGYCAWACPYGAPRLDARSGVMTKCDLCRHRLAEGRGPACVEACMMRVLTLGEFADGDARGTDVFPLPPPELTEPRTALEPHRDVPRAAGDTPRIANEEEL